MARRALVALLALLLGAVVTPAGAQTEADITEIERQIQDLNQQIKAHKAEQSAVALELAATEARMAELRAALAEAQARVDAVESRIATKEAELVDLGSQLTLLRSELAATRAELLETRRAIRERAVDLYIHGALGVGAVLLSIHEVSEVAVGLEYAEQVMESSGALLKSLEVLRTQEERQEQAIETRRQQVEQTVALLELERAALEADRQQLAERRAAVERELEHQRELLERVNRLIANAEDHVEHLEADAARIREEIRRRESGEGSRPGILAWPVNGPVVSPFGYRIHPIFGTRRLHTGIDIDAPHGSPIRAAGSGTVILARWYGGYGNAVVVDHGGGLTTLYAHQSSLAVSEGRRVTEGETIGYIGCTGYCTGSHLHFETRESGTPVDPMKYLGS